jgi:hypothetical protein
MEKERINGPSRGVVEPVTDLTLKENPGYIIIEMGARQAFYLLGRVLIGYELCRCSTS